jgi:hypothetical protein
LPTGLKVSQSACFAVVVCYLTAMTKLLDDALEVARSLPPKAQDDIARVVLRLAGTDDEAPVALSPEERAAVATSKAAAARGEFATDDQVRAVWAKRAL